MLSTLSFEKSARACISSSFTFRMTSSPSASSRLSGDGLATITGTWPLSGRSGVLAGSLPLLRRIIEMPVMPADARRAMVSLRIGASLSTRTRAITRRGSCGSSRRPVTSPILMPLNSTVPPRDRPDTASSKTMS